MVIEGYVWQRVRISREMLPRLRELASIRVQNIEPPFELTIRELDILTLLAGGLSNENISARLDISARTVAKHVENIFHKTGLWSRSALAASAVDKGLLRLPTPGGHSGYFLATGQIDEIAEKLDKLSRQTLVPKPSSSRTLRPLVIGLPYAGSGRGTADSVEMLNGAELAVMEINDHGGLLGRRITLQPVSFETGNEASILAAYREMIDNDVDAITAGYACYSPEVHDLVGEAGIPYLHAATMGRAVNRVRDSRARLGNIFQTCASDINYGLGLIRFVEQMQATHHWSALRKRLTIV